MKNAMALDSRHIIYEQDTTGGELDHVLISDLQGNARDLTPFPKVRAAIVALSVRHPDTMLIALNRSDPRWQDVYSVNLPTGDLTLDTPNPGSADSFYADAELHVLVATRTAEEGGVDLLVRPNVNVPWTLQKHWTTDENYSGFSGFVPDSQAYLIRASGSADAVGLLKASLSGSGTFLVAQKAGAEVDGTSVDPTTGQIDAVRFSRQRQSWKPLTAAMASSLANLTRICGGEVNITSRSNDNSVWTVECTRATKSLATYLYFPKRHHAELLFSQNPGLDHFVLADMKPISFQARDGMRLFGYLTLPAGLASKGLPLVINVHGGPWERDRWGMHPDVQLLANRGYAVLQVNYRGSKGYGQKYLNAGNREWGRKMEEDLIDAKRWAVSKGYADPRKTCIMGASYGGYAALAGLAFFPDEFACGVDMAGPADLVLLRDSYAPFLTAMRRSYAERVGGDEAFLKERSPIYAAGKIKKPIFIAQSRNDPRVTMEQGDRIVQTLRAGGGQVEYLVIGNEGHSLSKSEDRLFLIGNIETFLAKTLGGRVETKAAVTPSNIEVR